MTDIDSLRKLSSRHSLKTSVSPVANGLPDWIFDNGILRNVKADYFSIGLYTQDSRDALLLMTQKEPALIMLLVCNIDGQDAVLLSLRTEPGLIGLTNYSSTIQSTASNYLRRHGGKSTAFIEVAMDPESHGKVLYEGYHHDWGDYYLNKVKKFLIVELESPVEAPTGFCWVSLATAKALLLENHLVTNDLRVCMPLLAARPDERLTELAALSSVDNSSSLHSLDFSAEAVDCRGTKVSFFKTETQTREVNSWIQPLLVPRGSMKIHLAFARYSSGRIYAIEKRTQPGLLGQQLWFPVDKFNGKIVQSIETSAEGGRFWQYPIQIALIEVAPPCDVTAEASDGVCWVEEKILATLVTQSLHTSLQLRMAWSLVYAKDISL